MQQHDDPKKRPLLTTEQLRIMRQGPRKINKGTPREEFEKLFQGQFAAAGPVIAGHRSH
jgi:hypothetical protein